MSAGDWIWWGVVLAALVVGFVALFRSLRRWQSPPPKTPEQIQADMRLTAETHESQRW
jgi:cytochrome c-type biogenesis protein CcmH/NrfF